MGGMALTLNIFSSSCSGTASMCLPRPCLTSIISLALTQSVTRYCHTKANANGQQDRQKLCHCQQSPFHYKATGHKIPMRNTISNRLVRISLGIWLLYRNEVLRRQYTTLVRPNYQLWQSLHCLRSDTLRPYFRVYHQGPVSYTHLTLPTKRIV